MGGPLGDGGPAANAQVTPAGAAIDSAGNIYIADYWNERIRRVDAATGVIGTVAGNGNGKTFSGMTGPAAQISIGVPTSIAIAPDGDIYWTTAGWVLRMDSAGNLSIAAGNGGCVYAGDGGPATLAPLCSPIALAFDTAGNLFVTESSCGCIREVDVVTGIIQTVAGTGSAGIGNDGIPATQSALTPVAIAFSAGALYIADAPQLSAGPDRIRAVTPATPPALPQPPTITQIGDAFDYRASFSPGAIVSLFGNYLGGAAPLSGQTGADGRITTTLGGGQVSFNGIPAPLLYTSAGQINTIVPYATATGNIAVQAATNAGTASSGIYVLSSSLSLINGLVFNSDGTLNSVGNPAPKGSTLVMYGTGMGQTSPAGVDGSIVTGPPFPTPLTSFSAIVQQGTTQYQAAIQYLGPLPDFVAGAMQVNIQIPGSLPAGKSTLSVGPTGDLPAGAMPQTIYTLSDPPLLTGISPASPITEVVGNGVYLTLTGSNLTGVSTFIFF